MKAARRFRFHGRVQGVYFRAQSRRAARGLGLTGWVRNLRDGTVEAHAEGDVEALRAFEQRARDTFDHAVVSRCDTEPAEPEDHPSFEIRY